MDDLPYESIPKADQLQLMERMCHEFRSILTVILGYASFIADSKLRPSNGDLEIYGEIIVKNTDRLQRMVEDGLAVARIEGGHLNLVCSPIRVGRLVKATAADARSQTGRNIDYQDCGMELLVQADPLWLNEALGKIIDNALKFSPPETCVEICIGHNPVDHEVCIQVKDQGLGIAEVDQAKLFQPYGRICSEETRSIPGSGLGLFIANEIIKRQGGRIHVKSQPGEGSVFTIWLPEIRNPEMSPQGEEQN